MNFFGLWQTQPSIAEQSKQWKRECSRSIRKLDRSIADIKREEAKTRAEIKKLAKIGETKAMRPLAKELVNSKRARDRLFTGRTQINSIMMQIQTQTATSKLAESMKLSTDAVQSMNSCMRIPELYSTVRDLAMEMDKAGVMEEMIDDTFEILQEEDEIEDDQLEKEMADALREVLGENAVPDKKVPENNIAVPSTASLEFPEVPSGAFEEPPVAVVEEKDPIQTIKQRLQALS